MRIVKFAMALIISSTISASAWAQSSKCPNLDGNWQRQGDSLTILFTQNHANCTLSGKSVSSGWNHSISVAKTSEGIYRGTTQRTSIPPKPPCTGYLDATLKILDSNTISMEASFLSGDTCEGVGPGFRTSSPEIYRRN